MKNQSFDVNGLTELNQQECRSISGGWFPIAVTIGLIVSAINNFGDIRQGLADGFNGTPRYGNE